LKTIRQIVLTAAIFALVSSSQIARADRSGYNKVVDLSTESSTIRVEHHHDWRVATTDSRWQMTVSDPAYPFLAENHDAYLRVLDKATGAELFKRPGPALSYLWISPDSKYIVGLSNIMLRNPYQLVVYNRAGDRLLEKNMVDVKWRGVTRSVTNWINWYKEPTPDISVVENGSTATLLVEDAGDVYRQFPFAVSRVD
jgi:hypothetical protein